jgi:hypothetical protein
VINLDGQASPGLVPNGTPTNTTVSIKCEVTAQLVDPIDGSLRVADNGDNTRSFLPTGRAQWSWPVTALKSGHHDLELVVQPALVVDDEVYGSTPSAQQLSFVTDVNVTTSFSQRAASWVSENWPSVIAVATVFGGAMIGFVKWAGSVGLAVRTTRQEWGHGGGDGRQGDQAPAPPRSDEDRESTGYM